MTKQSLTKQPVVEQLVTKRPKNEHDRYHAHVYFDAESVEQATVLCEAAREKFGVAMGRVHQRPVGPHPCWSCQLSFDSNQFDSLIPWLDGNRQGLTVFVHALTGDDLTDHTIHASWLGSSVPLKLSIFGG